MENVADELKTMISRGEWFNVAKAITFEHVAQLRESYDFTDNIIRAIDPILAKK